MPLRDMDREQAWLLPPTLDEMLPLDHPARFVAEFVDALDREGWKELGVEIEGDPLGAPAYHPRALLSVWLYGFMTGVRSCRKLEVACRDQIPYLWLTARQRPDHNTLWRFYQGHRQAMRKLFRRTVRTAVAMDLIDLAVQAVDGTKVMANAARDRSYDEEGLSRLLERVEKSIEDLEARNETDEDCAPARLPQELSNHEALRERVRESMDELASGATGKHINLTDGEARLMRNCHGIIPAYNAQAVVSPAVVNGDVVGMLITGAEVFTNPDDHDQLIPMLEQAEDTTARKAGLTVADAGYYSGTNLEACNYASLKVVIPENRPKAREHPYHKDRFVYDEASDSYTCPQGQRLDFARYMGGNKAGVRLYLGSAEVCRACPAFGVCTKNRTQGRALGVGPHDTSLRNHRKWMSTRQARTSLKRRAPLVESVFGILKEQMGAKRFALRGQANVSAEWNLLATAFNLRTLWSIWRTSQGSISSLEWYR